MILYSLTDSSDISSNLIIKINTMESDDSLIGGLGENSMKTAVKKRNVRVIQDYIVYTSESLGSG
jgi:hypothetical protein